MPTPAALRKERVRLAATIAAQSHPSTVSRASLRPQSALGTRLPSELQQDLARDLAASAASVQRNVGSTFDLIPSRADLLNAVDRALEDHQLRVRAADASPPAPEASANTIDPLWAAIARGASSATMLKESAAGFPSMRPMLSTAASDLSLLVKAAQSLSDETERLRAAARRFEDEFATRVEDARQKQFNELAVTQRAISDRDAEMQDVLRNAERLRDELAAHRRTVDELREREAIMEEEARGLRIDAAVKRDALLTAQNKVNTVVAENLFLRKICAHNDDLLQEAELLRAEVEAKDAESRKHQQARSSLLSEATKEKAMLVQQIVKLKATVDQQQDEMVLLRRAYHEAAAAAGECRRQRDDVVTTSTPRPALLPLINSLGLDGASTGVGPEGRYRTADLSTQLVARCNELRSALRSTKGVLEAQCRMAPLLGIDDFEAVQTKGHGFAPSLPITSATVVARGRHGSVPPYLRFDGLVMVRAVSLAEIAAVFNEFRQWLRKGDAPKADAKARAFVADDGVDVHSAAAFGFAHFVWSRFGPDGPDEGSPQKAADYAYSYHHAIQQWRVAAPQAECFALLLDGMMQDTFYDAALERIRQLLQSLRATAAKAVGTAVNAGAGGTTGAGSAGSSATQAAAAAAKKRGTVKRKMFFDALQQAMPGLSDGDHLRLRAVANAELDRIGADSRDDVPLASLLEESGANGVLLPFAAALLRAMIVNTQCYAADVLKSLAAVDKAAAAVSCDDLATAIRRADPDAEKRVNVADFVTAIFADATAERDAAAATSQQPGSASSSGNSSYTVPYCFLVRPVHRHCLGRSRIPEQSVQNDQAQPILEPRRLEEISRRALLTLRRAGNSNPAMFGGKPSSAPL
jgi:hypothetical protein